MGININQVSPWATLPPPDSQSLGEGSGGSHSGAMSSTDVCVNAVVNTSERCGSEVTHDVHSVAPCSLCGDGDDAALVDDNLSSRRIQQGPPPKGAISRRSASDRLHAR